MRFREVFRFDLANRLRHPSTWLYLALVFALGVLRADATDVGVTQYHAPVNAAASMLMVGILGTLVTAGLFVEAAQRDPRWRMEPLFYTLPLRRREYLGGRFASALLVNALVLLLVPAGLLAGVLTMDISPDETGTPRVIAYALPYLVFLLPNLLVNAAVLYGVAVVTRRSLPGYLAALFLAVLYMYALTAGQKTPENVAFWGLVDPTGAVAFQAQTRGWTRVELNTLLILPDALLLWNRVMWTAIGAAIIGVTFGFFRFRHFEPASRRRKAEAPAPAVRIGAITVAAAPRSFGGRTRVRQVFEAAAMAVHQTLMTRDFALAAAGLLGLTLMMVMEVPLFGGTALWPFTHDIAAGLSSSLNQTLIGMLTVFYAGELVWRERDAGIEKIADSTPVPDWVPFIGKFLALALMLVLLQAMLMAAGFLTQAVQGYYEFQPGLYLKLLFGMQLSEYLLFALLALFAHVLANQKYLGHVVAALAFVAIAQAPKLGIEHNLLVYGSDPGWMYSALNGLGPFLTPFVWFKLYWAAWALLLSAIAMLFWVRGAEGGARMRMRLARQRFTPRVVTGMAAIVLMVLGTGGFVFYNTNVLNDFRTARETGAVQAGYERRYKRFEHAPQPTLIAVRLHAEVYPGQRRATIRATYRLVNRSGVPIDSVHLSSVPNPVVTVRGIRFGRPARPVLNDAEHAYRIYALAQPLQPGDSLRLEFDLVVAPHGFGNKANISNDLPMVGEFTNIGSGLLPSIGYQRGVELSSADARRDHGLPPSGVRPSIHDVRARTVPRIPRIDFEGTVGTAGDHVAVLPGTLRRSWTQGGRRYFHYRADAPVLDFFALISARYAETRARWNGVDIRVLHHPAHGHNANRILRDAQASLAYLDSQFGPYPHRQFWMLEFPRYGNGARAYGAHVIYSEASIINRVRMDGPNAEYVDVPPLLGIAHEAAHQWWGQQVMGADVQGSQMLSETLAQYSAAMVMERTYGPESTRRFMKEMHERYLYGRGKHGTPEAPLLLTTDHSYIHYGKGAVAMYALKDYIGEARVNAALRRLVQRFRFSGPPHATTLDLYRELQAVSPDSLQYLLHDLLATITTWDLQATSARAEPVGGGRYRVTLDVETAKLRSDSIGNDTRVAMDEWVEIGVFARTGDDPGPPLYLGRHRVRSGRQTITLTVAGKPGSAGIDPDHKLIPRHPEALYAGYKFADVQVGGQEAAR